MTTANSYRELKQKIVDEALKDVSKSRRLREKRLLEAEMGSKARTLELAKKYNITYDPPANFGANTKVTEVKQSHQVVRDDKGKIVGTLAVPEQTYEQRKETAAAERKATTPTKETDFYTGPGVSDTRVTQQGQAIHDDRLKQTYGKDLQSQKEREYQKSIYKPTKKEFVGPKRIFSTPFERAVDRVLEREKKVTNNPYVKGTGKIASIITFGKGRPVEERGKIGRLAEKATAGILASPVVVPGTIAIGIQKAGLGARGLFKNTGGTLKEVFITAPKETAKIYDPRTDEGQLTYLFAATGAFVPALAAKRAPVSIPNEITFKVAKSQQYGDFVMTSKSPKTLGSGRTTTPNILKRDTHTFTTKNKPTGAPRVNVNIGNVKGTKVVQVSVKGKTYAQATKGQKTTVYASEAKAGRVKVTQKTVRFGKKVKAYNPKTQIYKVPEPKLIQETTTKTLKDKSSVQKKNKILEKRTDEFATTRLYEVKTGVFKKQRIAETERVQVTQTRQTKTSPLYESERVVFGDNISGVTQTKALNVKATPTKAKFGKLQTPKDIIEPGARADIGRFSAQKFRQQRASRVLSETEIRTKQLSGELKVQEVSRLPELAAEGKKALPKGKKAQLKGKTELKVQEVTIGERLKATESPLIRNNLMPKVRGRLSIRTPVGLVNGSKVGNLNREIPNVKILPKSAINEKLSNETKVNPDTQSDVKIYSDIRTKVDVRTKTGTAQKTNQSIKTDTIQENISISDVNISSRSVPISALRTPTETGLRILPSAGAKATTQKVQGYNTYMIEGGQVVKANVQPNTEDEAHRLGRDIADNSVSASYKISKAQNKKVPRAQRSVMATGSSPSFSKFRRSKSRPNFATEKRKFRIDSPGEKSGLKASQLIKQRKRSLKSWRL